MGTIYTSRNHLTCQQLLAIRRTVGSHYLRYMTRCRRVTCYAGTLQMEIIATTNEMNTFLIAQALVLFESIEVIVWASE